MVTLGGRWVALGAAGGNSPISAEDSLLAHPDPAPSPGSVRCALALYSPLFQTFFKGRVQRAWDD
jgi:hypothetical protein